VQRIAEADDILAARSAIAELFMDQKVVDYIVDAGACDARAGRGGSAGAEAVDRLRRLARASIYLAQAARAHAYCAAGLRRTRGRQGDGARRAAAPGAPDVRAEAEDVDTDRVISKILEAVGVP